MLTTTNWHFRNGLLDLKTGAIRPFEPTDYITHRSPVAYDHEAKCPTFTHFLSETFNGDETLIDYLKAIMGYWLTGRTDRQEFYILYGEGANGKTTLLNVVNYILGEYCGSLMVETLFEGRNGQQNGYDLASLLGARLAIVQRVNPPLG